jgi:RNA polymerase sigma factor (sigma-70 family)
MTEEDFDRVLRDYGPALRRLAWSWERDSAAREDLLQEILFALWRALLSFRGESSEKTFVFRVAHNRALTHRFRPQQKTDDLELAAHVADSRPSPEDSAGRSQAMERLIRGLQRLPVAARQVLTLSLEGFSRAEMAEVLGVTETNAGVRLSRARKALQEEMNR